MSFKTFCGNGFSNTTKNCQTSSSHKPQYIFGWEDIKRCYATSGNNPVWKKNNVWWTLLALAHHLYNATLISKIMQSWRWKAAFIHRQTVHEIFIGNSSLFKTDFNFCSSPPPSHKRGFPTKQPVAGIRMLTAEVKDHFKVSAESMHASDYGPLLWSPSFLAFQRTMQQTSTLPKISWNKAFVFYLAIIMILPCFSVGKIS